MIRPSLLPAASVLAGAALVLTGCGGSGSSSPGAESGPSSAGASGSSTSGGAKAVVQGVKLTPDGSSLKVGDTAHVSWQPDQKKTGVIAVRVTRLQKVPLSAFKDWRLTGSVLKSTPYYVHATVKNLGTSNLSGMPVPLYVLDGGNTLLESSTFRARYAACPSRPFPAKFTRGRTTSVCLVYFAPDHGKLDAVSFRPTQDVDGITWRGPVTVVKATQKSKH
ncbi:MAG: hypothetical protein WAV00_20400 [Nocardioides sp.]